MLIKPGSIAFVCALGFVMALAAPACQSKPGTAAGNDNAAQAIYAYLQARVDGDANRIVALSCSKWEPQARIEVASFKAVKPRLEEVSCKTAGTDGETTLVTCLGKIVTSYNGERRDFDVSHRQYVAVNDGGEWRMCGYR